MDSRGRALDNIFIERFRRTLKYEFLYCNEFTSAGDLSKRLSEYIRYYNNERYRSSVGGTRPPSMSALRQKELPRNFGYFGELLILDKGSTIITDPITIALSSKYFFYALRTKQGL